MNYWISIGLLSCAFSFLLSRLVIRLLGKRLMDIPGERSSHSLPTPRGGGIAIAATTVLACAGVAVYNPDNSLSLTIIFLIASMATLGAFDDFLNLGIRVRLIIQFVLSLIGAFVATNQPHYQALDILILAFAVIALMWHSNLYNFMDGINGIATVQSICICLVMGTILYRTNSDTTIITMLVITGSASTGFLYWNFPGARIFMGDSGSLFLGFVFGLAAIKTGINSLEIAAAWLISGAVFIVDASYTLIARLLTGQKFYLPHRSHCYQKLASRFNSHTKITLLVCAVNLGWLFPIALLMISQSLNPFVAVTVAYLPLILIAALLKAGKPEQ